MQDYIRGLLLKKAFHGLDEESMSNLYNYVKEGKPIFFGPAAEEDWLGDNRIP